MESTGSAQPRRISDSVDAVCSKCKQAAYREEVIGDLQEDGTYKFQKRVTGCFVQGCDSEGIPTGPVVPKCNCED